VYNTKRTPFINHNFSQNLEQAHFKKRSICVAFLSLSHVSLQKENEADDDDCLLLLLSQAYVIRG
jgi:hypothetical protein